MTFFPLWSIQSTRFNIMKYVKLAIKLLTALLRIIIHNE